MLADLCPCFHQSPTKLCPDLVLFTCWIVTKFWSFTRKSVPDTVIRALNCARFCVVCALNCARILVVRLCPISFAPCPFSQPSCNNVKERAQPERTTSVDGPVEVVLVLLRRDGEHLVVDGGHVARTAVLVLPEHVHVPQLVGAEVHADRLHGALKQPANTQPQRAYSMPHAACRARTQQHTHTQQ